MSIIHVQTCLLITSAPHHDWLGGKSEIQSDMRTVSHSDLVSANEHANSVTTALVNSRNIVFICGKKLYHGPNTIWN